MPLKVNKTWGTSCNYKNEKKIGIHKTARQMLTEILKQFLFAALAGLNIHHKNRYIVKILTSNITSRMCGKGYTSYQFFHGIILGEIVVGLQFKSRVRLVFF